MSGAEHRAFEAVGKSPRLSDLADITRALAEAAATTRRVEWTDAEKVRRLADEMALTHEHAATPFGNALAVLERGPEDDAERALAAALLAHALALAPPASPEDTDRTAGDLLWLAAHTPFDATSLVDAALGDRAEAMWAAIADRIRRVDARKGASIGRGEALLGAVALALSPAEAAKKLASALASELKDPALLHAVRSGNGGDAPSSNAGAGRPQKRTIVGEVGPKPRSVVATALLAITGALLVMNVGRLLGRLALGYRTEATLDVTTAGVEVESRTEILGRTLRKRRTTIGRDALIRATREVRFPGAPIYAGLLSLAVGSYFGVSLLLDGVRAASPSLLLAGLLVVALGIALDFVILSLVPGTRGLCRVVFEPRKGPPVCVANVDAKDADEALDVLRAAA
jgi:hypothetical protein